MKAVLLTSYGGNETLQISNNAPEPTPKPDQVLIEVYAAGVNPFDLTVRSGHMKAWSKLELPFTAGGDFAGVVKSLAPEIQDLHEKDEVYGSASVFNGGSGSFAEFTAANLINISTKPKNCSFEEAAALPVVGTSAVQALEEHIKLQKDQKILIHGGAGGIGHLAIQLSKYIGAYVATTVSAEDTGFVKSLGADLVINYAEQKFEDFVQDYDAVYDTVGGEVTTRSFAVLKKGGTLVSMTGEPNPEIAQQKEIIAIAQHTKVQKNNLERLAQLVDERHLKVHMDHVYKLEDVQSAYEVVEKHPRGKVVIKIK